MGTSVRTFTRDCYDPFSIAARMQAYDAFWGTLLGVRYLWWCLAALAESNENVWKVGVPMGWQHH